MKLELQDSFESVSGSLRKVLFHKLLLSSVGFITVEQDVSTTL